MSDIVNAIISDPNFQQYVAVAIVFQFNESLACIGKGRLMALCHMAGLAARTTYDIMLSFLRKVLKIMIVSCSEYQIVVFGKNT